VSDETSKAVTYICTEGGHNIVQRIVGFWPVPVGGIVEIGGAGGNRDYGVGAVRMRVAGVGEQTRIDIYPDCAQIPTGLGL